jgi:hypothetical protein
VDFFAAQGMLFVTKNVENGLTRGGDLPVFLA